MIQHALFLQLECVLGPLTEKQQQLVQTLEVIRIEQMVPPRFRVPGRPPKDRAAMARSAYLNVLSFKRSGQRAHAHALLLHSHIQRRFDRDVHRNGDTHLPSSQRARSRNVVALYDASTDGFGKAVGRHFDSVVAIFALCDCIRQILASSSPGRSSSS